MDFNTASGNTAMIRTQAISGGSPKVLAKKTSTQPSDVYSSPVMDDKYIYADAHRHWPSSELRPHQP